MFPPQVLRVLFIAEADVTSDMGSSLWPEAPEVKFWLLHCPEQRKQPGVLMFDMTFEEEALIVESY